MGEVSTEEKVKICTNFMLNAPPGEFMEVVTDIRGLLGGEESILNDSAPTTFRDYITDQMVAVDSPNNSHKVLITRHGEVGDGEYLDPKGKQVILYDQIKQVVTGSKPMTSGLDAGVEELRSAVEPEALEYCAQYYPTGACTVYGPNSKTIIICISSCIFNSSNFWNGRWRSVWTCTIGGGKVDMEGTIKINAHFYEDGNVQLNSDTKKSTSAPQSDAKTTAKAIIAAIKKAEMNFQASLDTSYTSMGETTFKALRRHLPITRKKVDWDRILTYKLGAAIGGRMPQAK